MAEHMGGRPAEAVTERPVKSADETGTADSVHADQLSLDDLERARRRRDHGQEVATWSTDIAWKEAADRVIRELAAAGEPFTAEELRAIVGPPFGSPNALGPRFMAAARAGIIARVGSRQSTRPEAAGRWLAVWRGAA